MCTGYIYIYIVIQGLLPKTVLWDMGPPSLWAPPRIIVDSVAFVSASISFFLDATRLSKLATAEFSSAVASAKSLGEKP